MMVNVSQHKLIDGIFEPNEAKTLINSLIDNKISFHSLEDFSSQIRFNKDTNNSKKRIEELNKMNTLINDVINQAETEKHTLEIECMIKITLR
jgi:hypothetical protein